MRRAALGVVVICLLAEALLRIDPVLPSMSAQMNPFRPSARPAVVAQGPEIPGCVESDTHGPPPTAWRWRVGDQVDESLKMLVAGDSVTLGSGVHSSDTWAVALGERLSVASGRSVEVVNGGVNAAGYCGVIRSVHHHVATEDFDRVVVGLFADDLEQRAVVLERGELRADPSQIDGGVGRVLTHSHLANWIWFQALRWAVGKAGPGMPYVVRPGRRVPPETLENLRLSVETLRDRVDLWVLNAPAGMGLCVAPIKPGSECDWLAEDMKLIAAVLRAAEVSWVDNQSLFDAASTDVMIPVELGWHARQGRLPVHPSAQGHAQIAAAVPSTWFRQTGSPSAAD